MKHFQEKLVSYSKTKNLHCKCKIGVSLSNNGIVIAFISGGQLYKDVHLTFKRAITIVDATVIKI